MSNSRPNDSCNECKKTKCIHKNVKINGTLDVKCDTTLEKNLTVMKNETVYGDSVVVGNSAIGMNLSVGDNALIGKDLTVNGNSDVVGNSTVGKDLTVDGNSSVAGNSTVGKDLTVDGNSTIGQNLSVNGNLNVSGSTTLNDVKSNVLCLNDRISAPPCNSTDNQGCLWTASPTAANPQPPLVVDKNQDPLHYQDSECRDYVVNTVPTDPFHGWWVATLKGSVSYDGTNYAKPATVFIDTTKSPIELYAYPGSGAQARELHPTERSGLSIRTYTRADAITLIQTGVLSTSIFIRTLRLQPDKKTIAGSVSISTFSQGGTTNWTLTKLDNPPTLRPYGPQEYSFQSSLDVSNPVFMFDEFCDLQLKEQPMTNVQLGFTQYCGLPAFRNYQQILKTTGVTYGTPTNPIKISKVQRTVSGGRVSLNTQPAPIKYLTVIYTTVPHHVNQFCKVTLSGFTGQASILNKTFDVVNYENRLFYDDDTNFTSSSTLQYRFCIEIDTQSLPADSYGYVTGLTGDEVLTVKIGPVTPSTEYKELLAAQLEMLYFAFKFSNHTNCRYYIKSTDPYYCIDTFANLQTALQNGTAVSRADIGTGRTRACGSAFYVNGATYQFTGALSYPNLGCAPLNNSFGMIPTLSTNVFAYHIPLENYLDFTPGFEPRNIWWRLTGPATTPFQQALGQAYYGDNTIGQTFEAIMWPVKVGSAPSASGGKVYCQLGNSTFNNYNSLIAQRYFFGRINPVLVNGQNIGYIRLCDENMQDPQSGMFIADFAPPGTSVGNPRVNYEAACRVLAEGMKYVVTTLGCSSRIILDIRANSGGTVTFSSIIASFFGGDRKNLEFIQTQTDSGFSLPLNIGNFDIYSDSANKSYSFKDLLPSLNSTFYPGSVLNNSGARVYILTNIQAASAADQLPHQFIGDNLDKNIGSGVTSVLFGNLSGILCGGTGNVQNMTTSAISFPITVNTSFTGSISGNILTVTGSVINGPLAINQIITGNNVLPNTYVTNYLTGTGGSGTYVVSISQSVASTALKVQNVSVPFNRFQFENAGAFMLKMRAEPKSLCNRGIWLKPNNPLAAINYLGPGPWPDAPEDNYYQDLGAPGATYPVPKLPGDVRPNPNLLPQYPAQPTLADRALWRDRWLEQTVWDALQP